MCYFKIIIPNYNNDKWLDKCLNSVFNQTFKDFKVIVIDDVSTDNSIEIIKEYPVKLITNKYRVYNGGARNLGIRYKVKSNYTFFLDSDDWLVDENALQKVHDRLESNPVDCLTIAYRLYYSDNDQLVYTMKRNSRKDLVWDDNGACWTKVIKTELIKEFPEGTLMEDTVQHINQCNYLNTFDSLEEPIIAYNRTNIESLTNPKKHQSIKWQTSIFRYIADLKELFCLDEECEARRKHTLGIKIDEVKRGMWGEW